MVGDFEEDVGGIIPARAGFTSRSAGRETRWADHPRSRGVYSEAWERFREAVGSSPLARGLRQLLQEALPRPGIIPARAGFTRVPAPGASGDTDHPRSRGVYKFASHRLPAGVGSSPLARGLLFLIWPTPYFPGIIPARAGFTRGASVDNAGQGDHPRSRGVYAALTGWERTRAGSSPLARGLRISPAELPPSLRIIPARAGFTPRQRLTSRRSRDHPRSRGVYADHKQGALTRWGSSPLARGLHAGATATTGARGIIPARAGFTVGGGGSGMGVPDHPRSRGVYGRGLPGRAPGAGSSPLARGLLDLNRFDRLEEGIIPARAGFTSYLRRRGAGRRDHPRSRGVYRGRLKNMPSR